MAALHLVVKRPTGLFGLCVLYSVLFSPSTAFH